MSSAPNVPRRAAMPHRAAVLIHAGAGPYGAELRDGEAEVRRVLDRVLAAARSQLEQGEQALAVAVGCVELLEDCPLFNAGVGSALCADGSVEMSAGAMRGSDRAAGAVAGIRTVRNPIRLAGLVLCGDQVLMIGSSAEARAVAGGLAVLPNEAFVTDRERARLSGSRSRQAAAAVDAARGTVGAVCLDRDGTLAAATSTGGISGQPPGRVGDSPLIGAGTWADDRVAVSCTGDGEAFIRAGAAARLAALVGAGARIEAAADTVLDEVRCLGGRGGLIALDAAGNAAHALTTEAMPRGSWHVGREPAVQIARVAARA